MRLVAEVLQHPLRLRFLIDTERYGVVGTVNVLQPLRQSQQADLVGDAHRLQRLQRGGNLPFAAIHQNQVGQRFALLHQPGVAAGQHLLHGGVVIGLVDGFDVEDPVFLFGGLAVAETDHRPDGILSQQVGVVKAFDVGRLLGQHQLLLHLLQQPVRQPPRLQQLTPVVLLLHEGGGVALGQLQQLELVARLGHQCFRLLELGLHREGEQDLPGMVFGTVAQFDDRHRQHILLAFLDALAHLQVLCLDDGAVHHLEVAYECGILIFCESEHRGVVYAGVHHGRFGLVILQRFHFELGLLRLFKFPFGRMAHHFCPHLLQYSLDVPFNDAYGVADVFLVFGLILQAGAWRLALFDVEVKTGAEFSGGNVFRGKLEVA